MIVARKITKFAFLPVKMSSQHWIWLRKYICYQQLKPVEEIHDMGWADAGNHVIVNRWKTVSKIKL